jgi:hypothetical protein
MIVRYNPFLRNILPFPEELIQGFTASGKIGKQGAMVSWV